MASTIVTKNSSTASAVPLTGDLTQGELAVNVTDKRLFTKNSGGTVVELGTNPASLSLPNGTANGVAYLNGSKVLTTGSALTFDGANFGVLSGSVTTPATKIHAVGNVRSSNGAGTIYTQIEPDSINAKGTILYNIVESGYSHSWYINTEQMRLTSTGLGIGTSSPAGRLDVNTTAGEVIYSSSDRSTNGQYISGILQRAKNSSSSYVSYAAVYGSITSNTASSEAGALTFWTMGSGSVAERARIDSSGNFLVNATTASAKFHVTGATNTSASNAFYVQSSDSTTFVVRNDGRINTGATTLSPYNNTTASAANMYVDSAGTLFRSTSALKYKQDIRNLEEYDISTFRPVRYKSTCDGDDQTIDHLGFIADWEDEAGHKELVSYGKDGEVEGFQYDRMTAILTKVVQQQQALIQQLTERITALEGK